MNYPQAVNEFWRIEESMELSSNQKLLYLSLLQVANENWWKSNVVSVTNSKLMRMCSFAQRITLARSRTALVKKKLIKYEAGKHDHTYSKYTLLFIRTNVKEVGYTAELLNTPTQVDTGYTTGYTTENSTEYITGLTNTPPLPIIIEINKNEKKSLPTNGRIFKILK